MSGSGTVLFVSHRRAQCGVYEFGQLLSSALEKSREFSFRLVECGNAADYHAAVKAHAPDVVIYNYHPSTLPWLDRRALAPHVMPHVGIIHEITQEVADNAESLLFDFVIGADPTLLLRNPRVFKTGRLIPSYENRSAPPAVPRIGSFGFGTPGKGFEALVERAHAEFAEAVIALNIPVSTFSDPNGEAARAIAERCRALVQKPGITLEISHDYLTQKQVLDFLAGNSLNAFFYEQTSGRGVSSAIDCALAVSRPIAITRSSMFRHILSAKPSIFVEDSRLPDILARGLAPLAPFAREWTAENIIWDYERIVRSVLARRLPGRGSVLSPLRRRLAVNPSVERARRFANRVLPVVAPAAQRVRRTLATSRAGSHLMKVVRSSSPLSTGLSSLKAVVSAGARSTDGSTDWVPTSGTGSYQAPFTAVDAEPYQLIPMVGRLNRILDSSACALYSPAIDYMFRHMPEAMSRKIARANVQQAFVLDTVLRLASGMSRPKILSIGSYEDTAAMGVMLSGYEVEEVDPVLNYDLGTFLTKPSCVRSSYDVVFSTSVIEHIADDEQFVRDIDALLAPGGVGVLTCDFNDTYRPGDRVPLEDRRFYTQHDLRERLLSVMPGCTLLGEPDWTCDVPDFSYGGCRYTFASFVVRKGAPIAA